MLEIRDWIVTNASDAFTRSTIVFLFMKEKICASLALASVGSEGTVPFGLYSTVIFVAICPTSFM